MFDHGPAEARTLATTETVTMPFQRSQRPLGLTRRQLLLATGGTLAAPFVHGEVAQSRAIASLI